MHTHLSGRAVRPRFIPHDHERLAADHDGVRGRLSRGEVHREGHSIAASTDGKVSGLGRPIASPSLPRWLDGSIRSQRNWMEAVGNLLCVPFVSGNSCFMARAVWGSEAAVADAAVVAVFEF